METQWRYSGDAVEIQGRCGEILGEIWVRDSGECSSACAEWRAAAARCATSACSSLVRVTVRVRVGVRVKVMVGVGDRVRVRVRLG